ncbi:MAG: YraN family protein [Lachnospiraceae bacterium]|jgi:putative endonuclease|nr:YraN family protein [Lachnospiraceae bacterium]
MYERHITGANGEQKVQQYLINKNYKVIDTNFECKFGEIDIIARDLNTEYLVFIEVKTRTNGLYGVPADAVTPKKRKHFFKSIEYFLYKYNLQKEFVRIDVIEVYNMKNTYKINHIKQAFF